MLILATTRPVGPALCRWLPVATNYKGKPHVVVVVVELKIFFTHIIINPSNIVQ